MSVHSDEELNDGDNLFHKAISTSELRFSEQKRRQSDFIAGIFFVAKLNPDMSSAPRWYIVNDSSQYNPWHRC